MKNFVKMPMAMLAYGTKWYVTDDEAIVYAHLVLERPYKMETKIHTNIELIYGYLKWNDTNPGRGKKRILTALIGLFNKGYITISYDDEKLKNNSFLTIEFYLVEDNLVVMSADSHNSKFAGFVAVYYDTYSMAGMSGRNIKVIMHTIYRERIGYSISNSEWANVLQVSERTITREKDKWAEFVTETKGKKFTDSNGNARQEPSNYTVGESKIGLSKYPLKEDKAHNAYNGVMGDMEKCTDVRFKSNPNLFIPGRKLGVNDMYLWKTTTCCIAKEFGQKRWDSISKSSAGKAMIEDWKRKADSMIKKEEAKTHEKKVRKAQQQEQFTNTFLNDELPKYKQQKRMDDISEFLN